MTNDELKLKFTVKNYTMNIRISLFILIHFLLFIPLTIITGQTNNGAPVTLTGDSLTLAQIMQVVLQNHPSVKQAEEALNGADARIGLARASYYPDIDFTASYTHIAPDFALDFEGAGLLLFPRNSYGAAINVNQTIYDFGKTNNGIKVANENKNVLNKSIDLIKQQLSIKTINTFYTLVYYQKAINIKDEELNTLNEHLVYIEKKQATGSATQYELLSTKVRISNTENQKQDLLTYQDIQWSVLNTLTGFTFLKNQHLKPELKADLPDVASDSLINYAYSHRIELSIAKEKETQAQLNFEVVKTQNNPVLNAFASGGYKNGYITSFEASALDKLWGNYVVGVGLRVPLFDSNRHRYNVDEAKSTITSTGYDTDIEKRNISNEVVEANVNCIAAKKRIDQYHLQLAQAEEAYQLAKVNFDSGAITNLDLLDSETAVSESQLLLLKANIDYIVFTYRLKIALGDKF